SPARGPAFVLVALLLSPGHPVTLSPCQLVTLSPGQAPLLALSTEAVLGLVGTFFLCLLLAAGAGLFFVFAPGPRGSRAYKRALQLLHDGHWEQALEVAHEITGTGRLSTAWQGRVENLEGECHRTAGAPSPPAPRSA